MKKFSKILSVALLVALVLSLGVANAFAADPVTHTISTTSNTHTYEIYQIFTGTKSGDQLINLKYGQNAKTGTTGDSVTATDMAALDAIANASYANEQAMIAALTPYVDLNSDPIAKIGKGETASSVALPEGYYIIKDVDGSLANTLEGYTLYIFGSLLEDTVISPKSGTTTVDKTVTETNDTAGTTTAGQKGADYDEGDSIPYNLKIKLAENVTDYKTYTVTLTDTLSAGLTPPAQADVTVTLKDKSGEAITGYGAPSVAVDGQVITVTYTVGDGEHAIGDAGVALNEAVIDVNYSAVLNSNAKIGVEGNPNTYTLTYSNNPNGSDTGKTPDQEVKVYTYKLDIEKKDGNGEPLQGAGFTLYKEVTSTYTGAKTGEAIKAELPSGSRVDMSKLDNAKYYVPVTMNQVVTEDGGKVTKVTHETATKIDAGSYVLIETTVPVGYNAYAGENIVITSVINAEGELTGLTATPDTLTIDATKLDVVNGSVVNNSGTVLPSTGGIGTTIFYVVGGILVVAAGVLLITKKRMSE